MLTTLEGTLSLPLQEFVASEVKPIEDVVKLCEAARADVDVTAGKYLRVR
jgi:hypothetical protein